MARKHYHAINGDHGYMPDNVETFTSYRAACDSLISLFEIARTRKAGELRRTGSVELGPDYGAEYCEVVECYEDDCQEGDDEL
jgi:hypothetical protein